MIYDCFTFYNELDLLEIRLNVLNDVVDRFVLVEMNKTHMGDDKPFIFDENKERFTEFLGKIIHIKVENYPDLSTFEKDDIGNKWILEIYQRDQIMRGLNNAKDDDVIIISDLDEIPNPKCIKSYDRGIKALIQTNYYYFLNDKNITEPEWPCGSRIGHFSDLKNPKQDLPYNSRYSYSPKGMPTYFYCCNGEPIKNGGWHFSFVMDINKMILKRKSIVEQQFNTDENMNYEYIKQKVYEGKDLFGRNMEYEAVSIDKSFPEYIRKNQKKYSHLIFPITFNYKVCQIIKKIKKGLKFILKNIFSITNKYSDEKKHKIITILGFKISLSQKKKK